MYAVVFSSVGIIDALKLSLAVVCTTALNLIFAVLTQKAYINIGTALVYGALLFYVAVMVRFSKRIVVVMKYYLSGGHSQKKRVMIVGGGSAGLTLIKEMLTSDKIALKPVCIADDDPTKARKIHQRRQGRGDDARREKNWRKSTAFRKYS